MPIDFTSKHTQLRRQQRGFTLLEALISMLVIALGLLGLAGLQVKMQQAEFESYQRSQAIVLLYDMVDRIQTNREAAFCFRFTGTSGSPFLGTGGTVPSSCGAATGALALASMAEWHNTLLGAAETKGGASVGAMVGARGCVSYDASSEIISPSGPLIGTGIYTVSVSWQGLSETSPPAVSCGNALYGDETLRRTVSTTLRLAKLD